MILRYMFGEKKTADIFVPTQNSPGMGFEAQGIPVSYTHLDVYKRQGMEGLNKALKFLPDIIISDVMMPEKDGIAMTRELRADMTTSHIPIRCV